MHHKKSELGSHRWVFDQRNDLTVVCREEGQEPTSRMGVKERGCCNCPGKNGWGLKQVMVEKSTDSAHTLTANRTNFNG